MVQCIYIRQGGHHVGHWPTFLVLIYINDLIECCGAYSEVFVFADDAKFYRHILSDDDSKMMLYRSGQRNGC